MSLDDLVLTLHSFVRWLVVIFAVWAVVRAASGWANNRPWAPADRQAGLLFGMTLDVQALLGLLLYFFLDPETSPFQSGFAANPEGAYFTWLHFLPMLAALVLAHIGASRARKAEGDLNKHRTAAIFYALSILLILLAIPWPFTPFGAPLIRL